MHHFCCFFSFRASLNLSLGVAFVGAARRSLVHDSRSELGDRQWRRRLQRTFVGELGGKRVTDRQGERFDSYDYSRCRRVFCSCVVSSFHAFLIRVDACAGHIRFGDVEFRLARSCVLPHQAFANSVSGPVGWSQQGSWLAVPVRSILSLFHLSLVVALFSKDTGRIRFADVPASDQAT